MEIENIKQTQEFLEDVKNFFKNIDETEKKLKNDLWNKEGERGGVTDFIYPPKVYEMPEK